MRLLLFLVSLIFSFIFYSFYLLSLGRNIFGETVWRIKEIAPISGNFMIETVIFLFLAIFFIILFTPFEGADKKIKKEAILNTVFYAFLLIPLYFGLFQIDKIIITLIIIFLVGDFLFKVLSSIQVFSKYKLKLRYFGLILNYLTSIFSLMYFYTVNFSYYLLIICIYNIIFNYEIHKKYTNYISLGLSIISAILLILYLTLKIKEIGVN